MQYVNESETHSLSWGTLGTLLNRYKWLILAVFLVTTVTGWAVLQVFFTELYETQATLLVKVGRETSEVPTTVMNGSLLSQGVRIQDINSEVQMLSASDLVETAVDRIGPDKFKSVLYPPTSIWGYPKYALKVTARWAKGIYKEVLYALNLQKRLTPREDIIMGVAGSLKVEPVKESDVLVLKLRLPYPPLCVETAQVILSEYLRRRSEIRHNVAARDYFDAQTRLHRAKMQAGSAERAKVRGTWDISSVGEQRSLLLKQLADLESEAVSLQGQIRKLEQEQQQMAARLKTIPAKLTKEETFTRNPALQSLKERMTNLQMDRAKLLGRYQPDSELVKQVEAEIAALNATLAGETPTVLAVTTAENNPLWKEFEKGIEERQVAIAGLQNRLTKLQEPTGQIRVQLASLNTGSDAFERAERDYRLAEQSYLTFNRRLEESRLSEEMDSRNVANVSLIAGPNLPIAPVYPRKLFIMGILLPVALVLGIGIAALMESMNDRVRTESDLVLIPGVPYLGSMVLEQPLRVRANS